MTVFDSKEQAVGVFSQLFELLLQDETFSTRVREAGLSLRLVQSKPDFALHISNDGVRVDDITTPAALTIKMSSDNAHALWSGQLLMPLALATGKIRVRGSVTKMLEFQPLLQPAFDRYPQIALEAGVTA
jgi:putative sterol carrier protein